MKKHWYDYLWIASLLYLLLGFFNILFAWLGLLCFFIPLIISVVSGTKSYCNRYCGRVQLFGLLGGRFGGLHVDLNLQEHAHEGLADLVEQLLEHVEGLALVFLLGLLLSIAAQVDALTKGLKRGNVLAPQLVENLKENGAGKTREGLVTDYLLLLDVLGLGLLEKRLEQVVVRELVVRVKKLLEVDHNAELAGKLRLKTVEIPLLLNGLGRHIGAEEVRKEAFAQVLDVCGDGAAELREVLRPEDEQDYRENDEKLRHSHSQDFQTFLQIARAKRFCDLAPPDAARVTCLCKKGMFPIPFSNKITAFAATVMIAQCYRR